jgi:hypothetical protein
MQKCYFNRLLPLLGKQVNVEPRGTGQQRAEEIAFPALDDVFLLYGKIKELGDPPPLHYLSSG